MNERNTTTAERAQRICRSVDDAFAAGWADGADDKPLTPAEIARMVALHARYLLKPAA